VSFVFLVVKLYLLAPSRFCQRFTVVTEQSWILLFFRRRFAAAEYAHQVAAEDALNLFF
jgi:hypothetical protein